MSGLLTGWFRHLAISQKLLVSFGVILAVLMLSFTTLLLYLSRVNSYVERHQHMTVPAVITAAEMHRSLFRLRELVHTLQAHPLEASPAETAAHIETIGLRMAAALATYRTDHAARTNPLLFTMLTNHDRVDLADQEDQALADIVSGLEQVDAMPARPSVPSDSGAQPSPRTIQALARYDQTLTRLERDVETLIDVHRRIDTEMKLEGDRLVQEARFIALGLTALSACLIILIHAVMRRFIARPLRGISATADRVAHRELTAQFEPWPHRDEVGILASSLSSMVTTLRAQTAAVLRKTKELEAFTYSVAHDLKGPLREIEGFSSVLEKRMADSHDPDMRRSVEVIRRSALRLTHMIEALLRYSRLEQQDLPRQWFDVSDMVDGLIADWSGRGQQPKPTMLTEVPFRDLYGEPVSIRQALANLLENAIKFSRHSASPDIRIGGRRTPTERHLWVRDNGIGLSPEHHERIFGLFERLHDPQDYEGTGVGLAIVKMVMDKHGGRVWVESSAGAGSTFYLAFPDIPA